MDQIIVFLTSLSIQNESKWTSDSYIVNRVSEDCYNDIIATFNTETKDYNYYDMSANAQEIDSRIHSNKFQKNSTFISIGFLKKPYDDDMTKLYVAAHTERNNINPNDFEWLICYPTDKNVPNSRTVKSHHNLEDGLALFSSNQILSIISMLKLEMDFEEMREALDYQEISMREDEHLKYIRSVTENSFKDDTEENSMLNNVEFKKENRFMNISSVEKVLDVPNDDPYHVDNLVIETSIEPVPFCYD
jgi:hypothetical protein